MKFGKKFSSALVVGLLLVCSMAGCAKKISSTELHDDTQMNSSEVDLNNESTEPGEDLSGEQNAVEPSKIAYPSTTGKLQVVGTKLCDMNGNPVQLRGLSTHGIAWFPQFVNADFFKEMHSDWGANVIRIAMYTHENSGYCAGGDKAKLKQLVEDGVKYATDNDLYVIIDWHVLNEGSPQTYKEEAISFFDEMSKLYAGSTNVIYEICNEPCNGTQWSDIKSYANEVIPTIRANDEDAVIIVGTPNWSQDVDVVAGDPLTGYSNVMYALHFYAGTHKEWLRNKLTDALDKGLPVFVSEFGICDASGDGALDEESANTWIEMLNENDISYCCWNISNKDEASALFKASCSKTSGFTTEDMNGEGIWLYNLLRSYL